MRLRLIPLLDKLKDVVDQHSLTCCIYIASLGSAKPVFHEELLNKIFSRFVREISTARLKVIAEPVIFHFFIHIKFKLNAELIRIIE